MSKETEAKPKQEMNFLMNLVDPGNRAGIKGSRGAFYGVRQTCFVKPVALVLSHAVIWFKNCIVQVYVIGCKLLTQMTGMSQWPLVKSYLFSFPTLQIDSIGLDEENESAPSPDGMVPSFFHGLINNIPRSETKLYTIKDGDKYF